MDERAITLLRGLGMPAAEPEQAPWVERELTGLRTLADDGRAYRADLVADALGEGVRATGRLRAGDVSRPCWRRRRWPS